MDLIRDHGDKQLDLIGKISIEKTDGIKFRNEKSEKLKELTERVKDEIKSNKSKKFVHSAYNKTYDFNKYTDLSLFGNEIYTKKI